MNMDKEELTNRIYDTLSGNVGMSKYHVALKPESILQGECDAQKGKIKFQIGKRVFEIEIKEINSNYFSSL